MVFHFWFLLLKFQYAVLYYMNFSQCHDMIYFSVDYLVVAGVYVSSLERVIIADIQSWFS